jgi:hypothetical protein
MGGQPMDPGGIEPAGRVFDQHPGIVAAQLASHP